MASEWYTIQTLSGQEQKAEKSLQKRIAEEEMGEYINGETILVDGGMIATGLGVGRPNDK